MTRRDPFDQLLAAWVEDGPRSAPPGLLGELLVAFPARSQRRPLFGGLRGLSGVPRPGRLATAAAGVAIVGVVGLAILGSRNQPVAGPGGGPTPSASPVPTASPTPFCIGGKATPSASSRIPGAVLIDPGNVLLPGIDYTTPTFTPAFTLRAPDCLDLRAESDTTAFFSGQGTFFILRPNGVWDDGSKSFHALPQDLVRWLEARSDFMLAAPIGVVVGGYAGTLLDGSVTPGADTVAGYVLLSGSQGDLTGLSPRDHFELVVLEVRGQQLLIGLSAPAQSWTGVEPQLRALLASLTFPATGP